MLGLIFFFLFILMIAGVAHGFYLFIRLLAGSSDSSSSKNQGSLSRGAYLRQAITEIGMEIAKGGEDTRLRQLFTRYENELLTLDPSYKSASVSASEIPVPKPPSASESAADTRVNTDVIANWYHAQSVNLLLYLGAFLIVVACITFLSFTWNSLSGFTRFLSFFLFTLSFGIAGWGFYQNKRLSQAGVTFMGVAALLLPLNGFAFQRFVLESTVYTKEVLLVTSLMCLVGYILLFKILPNKFYAILLNISSLSLVISFFNILDASYQNYILASLLTSFILFAVNLTAMKGYPKDIQEIFDGSSQLILLGSMVLGFILLLSSGDLFTWQAVAALFLSSIYYGLRYVVFARENLWGVVIFSWIGAFFLGHYLDWSAFAISLLLVGYSVVVYLIGSGLSEYKKNKKIESQWLLTASVISAYLNLMIGWAAGLERIEVILLITVALGLVIAEYIIRSRHELLYVITGTLSVFWWLVNVEINSVVHGDELVRLSLLYFLTAAGYTLWYTDNHDRRDPLRVSILFMSALAYLTGLVAVESYTFVYISALNFILFIFFHRKMKEDEAVVLPGAALFVFVFSVLRFYDVDASYFGIAGTVTGSILYFRTYIPIFPLSEHRSFLLRSMGIGTAVLFSIIALFAPERVFPEGVASLFALILAACCLSDYALTNRKSGVEYLAGFWWVLLVLRVFYNLDLENSQFYIQPIAYYAIACGLYRFLKKKEDYMLYTSVGMFVSILSLFVKSFGFKGILYAVYLLVQGLVFVSIGISLQEKTMRYGGIVAIVLVVYAQTSEYVWNLPRWLLIGLLGFGILGLATYLMNRGNVIDITKKEEK